MREPGMRPESAGHLLPPDREDAVTVWPTPAVVLIDPKNSHNVGGAYRTCAGFGFTQLVYTGSRAEDEWLADGRLPREERMTPYTRLVGLAKGTGRFLSAFPSGTAIVGVEVHPTAEVLGQFVHPQGDVAYVFGPEDGSLPKGIRSACHRFVVIPSDVPLNLYAAVTAVLCDRRLQRQRAGLEPYWDARHIVRTIR